MGLLDWLLAAGLTGFFFCYFAVIGGAVMDIAAARRELKSPPHDQPRHEGGEADEGDRQ